MLADVVVIRQGVLLLLLVVIQPIWSNPWMHTIFTRTLPGRRQSFPHSFRAMNGQSTRLSQKLFASDTPSKLTEEIYTSKPCEHPRTNIYIRLSCNLQAMQTRVLVDPDLPSNQVNTF